MSLDQFHLLPPGEQQKILDGPALVPPNGTVLSLDNPSNNNASAIAVITVCMTIVTIFAILRAYSRIFILHKVFLEDYVAMLAYCCFLAFNYCCCRLLVNVGFFVHQWDVRVKNLFEAFYMLHLAGAFYAIIVMSTKIAILLEWVRIFVPPGTRGGFKTICRVVMTLNILTYSSTFLIVNLSCTPHEKIWNPTIPGTCIDNRRLMDVVTAALNIVSHFIILFIPQRVIWKLNITTKKRMGISLVFAVGLMALASSAVRLSVSIDFMVNDDKVYVLSSLALWALAEVTFIMLVFCIPAVPKIFAEKKPVSRAAASLRSWTRMSAKRASNNNNNNRTTAATSINNGGISGSKMSYQKIGENYVPLDNLNSWGGQVSSSVHSRAYDNREFPIDAPPKGILRTVQVQASEERQFGG